MPLAGFNAVGDSIGMEFRCLVILALAALGFFRLTAAYAMDCVDDRSDYDALGRTSTSLKIISAACGSLKIVDRRRDDTRHQVNIYAIYPVFDPVRGEAERRYNEWVNERPGKMKFTGPVEPDGADVADTMVGTLYRSPRLLSAAIGGWVCCGPHGFSWSDSLNIDSRTGQEVQLADLVKVADVTGHCWMEFSKLEGPMEGQGGIFARTYPPERFARLDQRVIWSVSDEQLTLGFGYMLGYVGGEFVCEISTAELPRFVKSGVTVPF